MKQKLYALSMLVAAVTTLSSCLGSDEEKTVTLHNDAALYTFVLGNMHQYFHPAGYPDSTAHNVVTGAYYPMTIDHLKGEVYNQDSLPVGTVRKALCTISTLNSGVVGLQPINDTTFYYFNSADSVDFSQPRTFRVQSSDGTFHRDYTVTVNVAKEGHENFAWLKTDSITLPAPLRQCQPVVLDGRLLMAEGNVVAKDDYAYRLNEEEISRSQDMQNWESVATATGLKQLLAAGTKELFAVGNDGLLKSSRDDGANWADERLDEGKELLPVGDMACIAFPYGPKKSTDYVLLAGKSANEADTTCNVWRKVSSYNETPEASQWVYMPKDPENIYKLPRQTGLSMALFDHNVLAIGDDLVFYRSSDQGITWFKDNRFSLPADMKGQQVVIATGNDCIWMVTDTGQVWNGKLR